MSGFVKNLSPIWRHALKRTIAPGMKINLLELYEQYGKKHGIPYGEQFVLWLRQIKLPDPQVWEIVLDNTMEIEKRKEDVKVVKEEQELNADLIPPFVSKNITVDEIVAMSVRVATKQIPFISNPKLISEALEKARKLAGKDTLCSLLRKRQKELKSLGR